MIRYLRPPRSASALTLFFAIASIWLVGPGHGAARAQTPPVLPLRSGEADPDSMMLETLRSIEGEPLTLQRAIELALGQSPDARAAEEAYLAAAATVRREKGSFDPELFATAEKSSDDQPSASPFAGAAVVETDHTTTSAGARVTLPFGTEVEASIATDKTESNSSFAALNPEDAATSRLQVRQPLLSGFGPGTRGPLTAAERRLEAARARRLESRLSVRSSVERTYWELYAAERDLAVQRLIVERASSIREEAQLRADAGLVGPNQVANAQVFLSEQQLVELDRSEALDQVSDRLASLLGQRPQSMRRFHPTDAPPETFDVDSDDSLLERARAGNPGLVAARLDAESVQAEERAARWNALPTLDLIGSLGGHGLGGRPHEVIFGADTLLTSIDGSLGNAIGDAVARDYPTWSVGVELTVPLFLREGRGERDRLRAERRRNDALVRGIEQTVEESVRARAQELRNGSRRLELARQAVAAAREQVRIGIIEFENGRTTAFELVRLGADLASTQQRYSDALVRTASAAAELRALLGEGAE
ncbi:MAG: TolC family protein [Candidatus Eisenbacteria bacterium]|uniref:TolC family protein n=1 Tax=Eiseniibacteriota bacterium TaxID=2212470 RepID=A0A956RRA3_UNCEI|nr:TolC family protein [Candidatus Eisenbacteria bacterium]